MALTALLFAPLPGFADAGAAARLADSLEAAEAEKGAASPDLLPLIDELAQARWHAGDLAAAAALRRRALGIAIGHFGHEAPRTAAAMTALAFVRIDQRRYLDAEPLLIVAERVSDARLPPDDPMLATISAGLARIALARGDTDSAIAWASRAVEIAGRAGGAAAPLRVLGEALTAVRRFERAEPLLRRALALDTERHGRDGGETARSLSQLGNLYLRWNRPAKALPLIEEATMIDQQRLGPTHPFVADDLFDLGLVYDALKRAGPARRAFAAAVALLEAGAGRDTPRVAYAELELSRLYRRGGDDAAAEAAFRDARRILNKAEAEEHRRERRA